jgi:hypothetical protein
VIAGVRGILHENLNVTQALELVESLKSKKTKRIELFSETRDE